MSINSELTPDQKAAHLFLSELRTRITTQPLPYQHGVEQAALVSLYGVFGHAREAMKECPGCEEFAEKVTEMLNLTLRPFTAKWHRASEAGHLLTRYGSDDFRCELVAVQENLREFANKTLSEMAYGQVCEDELGPNVWDNFPSELQSIFQDLKAGIPGDGAQMEKAIAKRIFAEEEKEIKWRREQVTGIPVDEQDEVNNAVGLALSGGGIRSATFCLGVVQALASRNLMKDVDYLSTVSGGGYTGSFVTQTIGSSEAAETNNTNEATSMPPMGEPTPSQITIARESKVKNLWQKLGKPNDADSDSVRFLRHRVRFLSAGKMALSTILGMVLNWILTRWLFRQTFQMHIGSAALQNKISLALADQLNL